MKKCLDLPGSSINDLVSEMKTIVNQSGDLNDHKENLTQIIQQVDFLLGKHDDVYNQYVDLFVAMGQLNFSKRLPIRKEGDTLINFFNSGINMLNEEFEENLLNKRVLHDFINGIPLENTLIAVTGPDGFIYFAHSTDALLKDFNDKFLINQSIHVLFNDFKIIQDRIKEEGTIRNIKTDFKWKNIIIPVKVDVIISNHFGKVESLIYLIKLGVV